MLGKFKTHSAIAALSQNTSATLMQELMILLALNKNTVQALRSSPQPSLQVVRCLFHRLIPTHAQPNVSIVLTVQKQAATAAHSSVKNALTAIFSARTTKLILRKSPLLAEQRFSNCATNSARRLSQLVLTATAVQLLATNANPSTMVNSVTPLLPLNLILPKFLMAAQPRTSSSKSAKIQRVPRSYALLTRSRLLDADAAQSKARSATLRLTERTAMVMYWTEAVFTKAALRD
jgi:hypothetical protein